jgi:hypothetical protein
MIARKPFRNDWPEFGSSPHRRTEAMNVFGIDHVEFSVGDAIAAGTIVPDPARAGQRSAR